MVSELYKLYLNETMTRVQCTVQSSVLYIVLFRVQCTVQYTVHSLCSTTKSKLFKYVFFVFFVGGGVIYVEYLKQKTSINKIVFIFVLN